MRFCLLREPRYSGNIGFWDIENRTQHCDLARSLLVSDQHFRQVFQHYLKAVTLLWQGLGVACVHWTWDKELPDSTVKFLDFNAIPEDFARDNMHPGPRNICRVAQEILASLES